MAYTAFANTGSGICTKPLISVHAAILCEIGLHIMYICILTDIVFHFYSIAVSKDLDLAEAAAVSARDSSVDCQSEPVRQESINHAMDQDREPSTEVKAEITGGSNGSMNGREEVGTETAESAEKAVGSGETSVDERDSECKAEREGERGEEGEGEREEEGEGERREEGERMELEERGEYRRAPGMETDLQRGEEGETVSIGKAQVC